MRTVTPNNNRGGRRWAVAAAGALVFGVLYSVVSAAGAIDRAADAPSAPAVRLHPPTITRALTYLGLSTFKSLVLGFSLVDSTKLSQDGFDMIDYWRRCVYAAAVPSSRFRSIASPNWFARQTVRAGAAAVKTRAPPSPARRTP